MDVKRSNNKKHDYSSCGIHKWEQICNAFHEQVELFLINLPILYFSLNFFENSYAHVSILFTGKFLVWCHFTANVLKHIGGSNGLEEVI